MEAFRDAESAGMTVAFKGGGNSYGDAFQNSENVVVEFCRMNRVLEWNPTTGVLRCEPGLTLRDMWEHTIADGWWPPVVSGTSAVTIGGALSANIHGKNNRHAGPIGEHVTRFVIVTPAGSELTCSPQENSEIFFAAIGGFGLLGAITEVELQMKRIYSGLLHVESVSIGNWAEAFEAFGKYADEKDYMVGWVDCIKDGQGAGRGLIHTASYLAKNEDPHPEETLSINAQALPDASFGFFARSRLHRLMSLLVNRFDMRFVNWAKYKMGRREHGKRILQPVVPFNFLLDSAPNWKWSYKPGALIQFQPFVPEARAPEVFARITGLARDRGHPPFLGVMKRHRPDKFLLTHSVDGYSLALDFPVYEAEREDLWRLCDEMADIVLGAGGRFYLAKDSTLTRARALRFLGEEAVKRFCGLKSELDPKNLIQSSLSRRVLP
jgi:FAD/FMN-containing dehydrogenase